MVWVPVCPKVTFLFNCLCESIKKWLGLFPCGGFNTLIWFSRAGYVSWHFCCSATQGTVFSLPLEDSALKAPSWCPGATLRQTPELQSLGLGLPNLHDSEEHVSVHYILARHLRYSVTAAQSRLAGHFLSMTPLGLVWGEGKDCLAWGHLNLLCQVITVPVQES